MYTINFKNPYAIKSKYTKKLFFNSRNFYIFSFSSLNANFHPISPTEFYSNATYFMLEVSFLSPYHSFMQNMYVHWNFIFYFLSPYVAKCWNFFRIALLLLSHFSCVRLCATPETAAHQAPPSLGFSRQEHWSGLPFPSPMHESEN